MSAQISALPPKADIRVTHRHVCLGDIAGPSLPYIVRGKGERWVESTPYQSGSLQGRRDDRAGRNARRRAGQRCGKLRNRETCGLEGCRDHGVRVDWVMRLPLFILSEPGFGQTVHAFGGCSSDDKGAAVSWNLNGC